MLGMIKTITNKKVDIDVRNDKGFVICDPTYYKLLNGDY
jgi:hypothetical protein